MATKRKPITVRQISNCSAYQAQQCPECSKWIYVAHGPFAEGDRTKPLAYTIHYEREHMTAAERKTAWGVPWAKYNTMPVTAEVM